MFGNFLCSLKLLIHFTFLPTAEIIIIIIIIVVVVVIIIHIHGRNIIFLIFSGRLKEMIQSMHHIPTSEQTLYQHGIPLPADTSLDHLALSPTGRLFLSVDAEKLVPQQAKSAFIIMECGCVQQIEAYFIGGKMLVGTSNPFHAED